MGERLIGRGFLALLVVVGMLGLAACAPAAPPPPTQPVKPAAPAPEPTKAAAPAAQPTKPAAPAAASPQPAAQPTQPAKPAAKAVVELRAGCAEVKGNPTGNAADKFAELVEQKSNGEVRVQVLYQALGVEQALTQAVMSGSVDIGMLSNGNAGSFTNAYFVYDLPFLARSYDKMLDSLDAPAGRKLIEQFEKDLGVKMLFPVSMGSSREIISRNKLLKTPADIKGLKIRVVGTPIDLATFKAWGANPTPLEYGQLYSALQQGVVEGFTGVVAVVYNSKFYEVTKYTLRIGYQALFQNFFMNAKTFQSLSPQHQKAIMDAAQEARTWNRKDAAQLDEQSEKKLIEVGHQVYKPTAEEYAQWASNREAMWKEVAEQQKDKIDLNIANQIYKDAQ